MAQLSTAISGKVRSGLFLLSALWVQGPRIAQLVLERLRSSLGEDEEAPPFLPHLETLGRLLQAALDLMVELDHKLYDEDARRAILLRKRQKIVAELGQKVTGIRRIVAGHHPTAQLRTARPRRPDPAGADRVDQTIRVDLRKATA